MDVEEYFKNYEFWTTPLSVDEVDLRYDIDRLINVLDALPFTEETCDLPEEMARLLLQFIFEAVSSVTGRFTWICKLEDEMLDYKEVREKRQAKYFLYRSYIIDRESYQPLVIGHIHADDALDSLESVKYAEDYLKSALEEWVHCARMEVLYGVIIIGAHIAFYQMDRKNKIFSRGVNGETEEIRSTPSTKKWTRLNRSEGEGLAELFNIVMKSLYKLYPDIVKKGIEFRRKKLEELAYKNDNPKKEDANNGNVKSLDRTLTVSGESSSSKSSADSGLGSDRETSSNREKHLGSSCSENSSEQSNDVDHQTRGVTW